MNPGGFVFAVITALIASATMFHDNEANKTARIHEFEKTCRFKILKFCLHDHEKTARLHEETARLNEKTIRDLEKTIRDYEEAFRTLEIIIALFFVSMTVLVILVCFFRARIIARMRATRMLE